MKWNLEEFFKNKKECLKELKNLDKIYNKVKIFQTYNMNNYENLKQYFEFYKKYFNYIKEFESYIDLLELEDYHTITLNTIKNEYDLKTSKINILINNIFQLIKKNNQLDLYKNEQNYQEYKEILNQFGIVEIKESEKYEEILNSLTNEIESHNLNNNNFNITILQILNSYHETLIKENNKSYEEIIFTEHKELTKEEYKKLSQILKNNSQINEQLITHKGRERKIKYEEAKVIITESLKVLGPEYQKELLKTLNNQTIDTQIRKYKSKDNLTYFAPGHHAFASLNYDNTMDSVFTLSHELGHMVEYNINQDKNVSTLMETVSLTNEIITGNYLLKKANTLDEKISISKMLQDLYYVNLYDTISTCELSLKIGQHIYKNGNLTLKKIEQLTIETLKEYNTDCIKEIWCYPNIIINDFYELYYIYGIIAATEINKAIKEKTFNYNDYIETLKKEKTNTFAIYQNLGFHPLAEKTINSCLEEYKKLIENTNGLIYEKNLKKRR